MKIGIDIRLIGKKRTGDEVVFLNLVKNLAQIDTKNSYVLVADNKSQIEIEAIAKQLGIDSNQRFSIVSICAKNKFHWNFWALQKYLRKNPVDIFLTQYITPWFVPEKIKIMTIVHDISFRALPLSEFWWPPIDPLLMRLFIPMSLKRANMIVAVSEFTKSELTKWYKTPEQKVSVMYNALASDYELVDEISEQEKKRLQDKYNLPEKFVLYVGTLQPRKQIPLLIGAFLASSLPREQYKLVLAGKRHANNYDWQIDELVRDELADDKKSPSVIFPGFVDQEDLPKIFRLSRVFAYVSKYEGFGIPLLEAMSQNTPVLCSDIPSLREVAQEAALLCCPQALDDFSKKLYDIAIDEDLRSELIRSGKSRVSFFSWKKSAQKMLSFFEELNNNNE